MFKPTGDIMSTSLHKAAIESGAELAPAYEVDGTLQPATYTVTLAQLEATVGKMSGRILAALDGMDRGCTEPGFRGHQNGYGEESAGDELQAAREELAALVGHVAAVEVEEPEIPWVETPFPETHI